jgi:hypothetical protein
VPRSLRTWSRIRTCKPKRVVYSHLVSPVTTSTLRCQILSPVRTRPGPRRGSCSHTSSGLESTVRGGSRDRTYGPQGAYALAGRRITTLPYLQDPRLTTRTSQSRPRGDPRVSLATALARLDVTCRGAREAAALFLGVRSGPWPQPLSNVPTVGLEPTLAGLSDQCLCRWARSAQQFPGHPTCL